MERLEHVLFPVRQAVRGREAAEDSFLHQPGSGSDKERILRWKRNRVDRLQHMGLPDGLEWVDRLHSELHLGSTEKVILLFFPHGELPSESTRGVSKVQNEITVRYRNLL